MPIQPILNQAVAALSQVAGIDAIVLGGSRARGTHTAASDVDIGLYYDKDTLDVQALDLAAARLDDAHREGLIAPPGGWGNWVDGGGWLTVDGVATDLILRDMARVRQAVTDCGEGRVTVHYQAGHPHAFLNAMYMGEVAVCRILWNPDGKMRALQAEAAAYPPALRDAMVGRFAFEASFSQQLAAKYADTGDPYYVTAHIVRAVSALNQVLFALNGEYCLNEKRAVRMIDGFAVRVDGYGDRVASIFALAGLDSTNACAQLGMLVGAVTALAEAQA